MKMLITVVSGLLMGLSLASSHFTPIQELQHFLNNKRRIFFSLGVAITGYFLVFSGVVIGLVEGALQFDAQGFLMWSSLFTVASGLALAGLFSELVAKAILPARVVHHASITEGLEVLLKHLSERHESERAAERQPENHQREEKFAETWSAPEPVFRDTPTADVLHH